MMTYHTNIPLEVIEFVVCGYFWKPKGYLFKETRKRDVITKRHLFYYFARKYTPLSLERIGEYKLKKNHATVLNGVKNIDGFIDVDKSVPVWVNDIEAILKKLSNSEPKMNLIIQIINTETNQEIAEILNLWLYENQV